MKTTNQHISIYFSVFQYISNCFRIFQHISVYFYLFLFISISPIYPQQDTLNYYLEIAVKENPLVMQRYYEYMAALQKIPQAGSLPDPEISMGVFLSPMELIGGNQVADIRLMQMFPWFGTLRAARDEMSLMAKAKYELFRETKLQVLYDVQRTWNDLHRVRQEIIISEKNVDILQTLERLSLVKYKAAATGPGMSPSSGSKMTQGTASGAGSGNGGMQGMGGNQNNAMTPGMQPGSVQDDQMNMVSRSGTTGLTDVYRIQIETGALKNSIALLKDQEKTVRARFNTFLNRDVHTPISLADTLVADTLIFAVDVAGDSIVENNPMLVMFQYEKQSLGARRKMVTRMGYPMAGLGIGYMVINKSEMAMSEMNGKDMVMPMISISLPIYRKKYKALREETDLLSDATEQAYQAMANDLRTQYYDALQTYYDAKRRIDLYAEQGMLAKKSFDIMLRSYAASGSDLADILRIRQQILEYDLKHVQAVSDLNTAVARLKRITNYEL